MRKSILWSIIVILVILVVIAFMGSFFMPGHHATEGANSFWGCFGGPFSFWGGGPFIFPLIMIGLFLLVIFLIFKKGNWPSSQQNTASETALDILKKRYAKGEITKEEFERIKKEIR